jgi:cytochrome P450/NADPH-cytochrome P450 reductase
MATSNLVPQPPLKPLIGNLAELDANSPIQSFMALARTYGPIFKLKIIDREMYLVSSQELVNELCDEARFHKRIHAPLKEIRAFAGDGLFTAHNSEPNWGKAHRILMPAFGPIGVRAMFDQMVDIAEQMFVRWERFGPGAVIDVPDNMTRLTLDTIALCGFGYRFNSFYQTEMHPFVAAMVGALDEAGKRARRPKVVSTLLVQKAMQFQSDTALMQSVAEDLIAERRRDPDGAGKSDLLNLMLNGVDPVTGEKLDDANIAHQMITFLIAGHETTSGLLSFATYLLLKNPEVMQKARAIVDKVLGDETPRIEHLAELRYIEQVLMESLRIWPTAAAFAVYPIADTVLGGKYPVTPEDTLLVLEPMLHRDPAVWGEDAEEFRPERFAPERAEQLPPNAWKPFGNGARACIGRPFAMQEAQLVLTMMLQRFDFVLDDPSYQLKIHETLTIKPEGLRIRARVRRDARPIGRPSPSAVKLAAVAPAPAASLDLANAIDLLVLYGSNTGSSEAFANRIAAEAPANGFRPSVARMDERASHLPKTGALVVVTASYEGQPPDNARQFVAHVESLPAGALTGATYAVFGCGNRQWARTYQAVPKRVDAALAAAGATRIVDRGEADSGGDFFGAFDTWLADLWPKMAAAFGKTATVAVETRALDLRFVETGREAALRLPDLEPGVVVENRELVDMSASGARSKRHIEFALPTGMTYRTGDYLAVLARNPRENVERVLRRFGLAADRLVVIGRSPAAMALPADIPVSCGELLANYVELSQPATRAQVEVLAAATRCPPEKAELDQLAAEVYNAEVLARRVSVIDLLDRFHSCELSFARYLEMLPPLKARQYSISSSPLWRPDHATLTVATVDAPAFSGSGRYRGVASSFLAGVRPGDRVSIAVRPSNARFHPPADPKTPIVMICAGSGLAPFRGFLQERAAQKAAGREVGPALLFFGADDPNVDFLYHEELGRWQGEGVVDVRAAFSERPDGDIRFVQHRVWADRHMIEQAFRAGATIFVCGDGQRMAPAVRKALVDIYRESTRADEAAAETWADAIERDHGRYVADIFI